MRRRCPAISLCATILVACCWAAVGSRVMAQGETVWLTDLDISKTPQAWGSAQKDRPVGGNRLHVGGQTFERGLGTHADSVLYVELDGGSRRFTAMVGVDGETPKSVTAKWSDLSLHGKMRVRNLWRQKDLGLFETQFGAEIPRHGVVLLRLYPTQPS